MLSGANWWGVCLDAAMDDFEVERVEMVLKFWRLRIGGRSVAGGYVLCVQLVAPF